MSVIQAGQYIQDGSVLWLVTSVSDPPPGTIIQGLYVPPGFVKLNGATVDRANYPRLVKIADNYNLWTDDTTNNPGLFGEGDGESTMVLPNFMGKFLEGADTDIGKYMEAGLPNITGDYNMFVFGVPNGAFYTDTTPAGNRGLNNGSVSTSSGNHFDASRSNSIYGSSRTVQPPAILLIPCIKY